MDPSLVPFKTRQDELGTRHGCLLWGARVIVPPSLEEKRDLKIEDGREDDGVPKDGKDWA